MYRECHTCLFADPHVGDDDSVYVECRRHPPQAVADPESGGLLMVWPQVKAGDWCGEYQKGA